MKTTRILQDDKCYVGDPSNVLPKESIDVGKGSIIYIVCSCYRKRNSI